MQCFLISVVEHFLISAVGCFFIPAMPSDLSVMISLLHLEFKRKNKDFSGLLIVKSKTFLKL